MREAEIIRHVFICFALCTCTANGMFAGTSPTISELHASLVRQGAYAFVADASTPKTAPHIHSPSWVEWLPAEETERRAFEQEKREFGLAFVGELEKCALRQRHLMDYEKLEQEIEGMLRTADWLSTSKGYGNYLLVHWAENLALNMLGKLSVLPEMDTNTVNRILARLSDSKTDASFRLSVLREESPEPFASPIFGHCGTDYYSLLREWGKGMKRTIEYFGPLDMFRKTWRDTTEAERKLAFYMDDSSSGELELRELWDRKLHRIFCTLAPEATRINAIRNTLLYRRFIGAFPLPSAQELEDDDCGKEYEHRIVCQWWLKELHRKYGPNCTGFWARLICSGNFLDQWTAVYYRRDDRESKKVTNQ